MNVGWISHIDRMSPRWSMTWMYDMIVARTRGRAAPDDAAAAACKGAGGTNAWAVCGSAVIITASRRPRATARTRRPWLADAVTANGAILQIGSDGAWESMQVQGGQRIIVMRRLHGVLDTSTSTDLDCLGRGRSMNRSTQTPGMQPEPPNPVIVCRSDIGGVGIKRLNGVVDPVCVWGCEWGLPHAQRKLN